MPISTAANRISAPPNHSPHGAKRRTPAISCSTCPRLPDTDGTPRASLRLVMAGLDPDIHPLCAKRWITGASPAMTVCRLLRRRLEAERLADGVVPLPGAFGAAA